MVKSARYSVYTSVPHTKTRLPKVLIQAKHRNRRLVSGDAEVVKHACGGAARTSTLYPTTVGSMGASTSPGGQALQSVAACLSRHPPEAGGGGGSDCCVRPTALW